MPFLLFIIFSAVEIYSLIKLGSAIGAFNTILWVFATACFGFWVLRTRGENSMSAIARAMEEGKDPQKTMLDNLMIFVGGLFLILPGIVSDFIGIMLMIPAVRSLFYGYTLETISKQSSRTGREGSAFFTIFDVKSGKGFERRTDTHFSQDYEHEESDQREAPRLTTAVIIDTDAETKDDKKTDNDRKNP